MALPRLTATRSLHGGSASYRGRGAALPGGAGLAPQGCLECLGAVAVCGASCLMGPEVCVPCLATAGMEACLRCLLD